MCTYIHKGNPMEVHVMFIKYDGICTDLVNMAIVERFHVQGKGVFPKIHRSDMYQCKFCNRKAC